MQTELVEILLVEDEPRVASFVAQALLESGFEVTVVATVAEAQANLAGESKALIILDLMLPDGSGLDVLRAARELHPNLPVLVLSARSSTSDRVGGLEAGADDYLAKPFELEELLARVRALLRRSRLKQEVLQCGDLTIDQVARKVARGGRTIFLSETEYRLLEILALNHGKPVSKTELLKHVWDDEGGNENLVEVYISYLRSKLEWRESSRIVRTVKGQGYALRDDDGD